MKSEKEIRQMLKILQAFRAKEDATTALLWVLGEYPGQLIDSAGDVPMEAVMTAV